MSMKDLFFATPWWLVTLLVIVAVALWWSGNNRRDKTLMRVGLGLLLATIALATLSYFVDTDVETVNKRTDLLIRSVENRDWKTFDSLLDQRTSFMGVYKNKDEISDGAKRTADAIGLKSINIIGRDVKPQDTVIQVFRTLMSDQDRSGRPVITNWQFDWQNFGTGWKLTTITPLKSDAVNPDNIVQNLERPR